MMFSVFCPTHDSQRLMTRRNVVDFCNTDEGPVIRWRCTCGHEGVVGRDGSVPDAVNAAAPAPLSKTA